MIDIPDEDPESFPMFRPLDMCRDPDSGRNVTTTDVPSAFAFVETRRGEVRARSLLEGLFCLHFWYLQLEDHPVHLLAS